MAEPVLFILNEELKDYFRLNSQLLPAGVELDKVNFVDSNVFLSYPLEGLQVVKNKEIGFKGDLGSSFHSAIYDITFKNGYIVNVKLS